ncbi:SymE family type I addiction module toxin [Pantoea vagans]|uniref:SymE family type I addiction module toxin n=1 Tax=Pantoea vagans TaxID=470934 RepID=UPI0023AEA5FB|nr:SymE family type I addiction module toxin [Pantoea vagans]MDE8555815.1 SymE family type I addiction module toxin [Pantoea vagans]MDE8575865.1 SymE family type I addiction module toxin [Pantoea vagans]
MTESECNAVDLNPEAPSVTRRKLMVSYASRYPSYIRIPSIIMKGQWLAAAGFTTGTEVEVGVTEGRIVLIVKPPEPVDEQLVNALAQLNKLPVRKRKHVLALSSVAAG